MVYMDYVVHEQGVRLVGTILLAEEGLGKALVKDFRSLGYKTTFSFLKPLIRG